LLSPDPYLRRSPFLAVSIFRHRLLDLRPIGHNQLVEGLRDGVIVVDDQHCIVDANSAARRLGDGPEREVIGESVSDLLPFTDPILWLWRRHFGPV